MSVAGVQAEAPTSAGVPPTSTPEIPQGLATDPDARAVRSCADVIPSRRSVSCVTTASGKVAVEPALGEAGGAGAEDGAALGGAADVAGEAADAPTDGEGEGDVLPQPVTAMANAATMAADEAMRRWDPAACRRRPMARRPRRGRAGGMTPSRVGPGPSTIMVTPSSLQPVGRPRAGRANDTSR